jgi:outer membrane lipoprotein LolB
MTESRRGFLALSASLLITACATPPTGERRIDNAPVRSPSEWKGRFSATYTVPGVPGDEQSASGRFGLTLRDGAIVLDLSTPIGQTIARTQVGPEGAWLTDNQGKIYRAATVETLTEQLFGWRVPLTSLPNWLQGRVSEPSATEAGRLRSGTDSGWQIRIDSWLDEGLVRAIELVWPAQGAIADRRIRLRLFVDAVS